MGFLSRIFKNILYVTKQNNHKIICICGLKLKFANKKELESDLLFKIQDLSNNLLSLQKNGE